jgi:hypothetical protein
VFLPQCQWPSFTPILWWQELTHHALVPCRSINFIVMCFSCVLGSRRTKTGHRVWVKLCEPVGRQGSDGSHDGPHLRVWCKVASVRRVPAALCWHQSCVLTTVIVLMYSLCY